MTTMGDIGPEVAPSTDESRICPVKLLFFMPPEGMNQRVIEELGFDKSKIYCDSACTGAKVLKLGLGLVPPTYPALVCPNDSGLTVQ